jgi:MFS family permease
LVYPVIISVTNYVTLAFLNIMLNALLPLFFAMPVEIGGLGFSPPTIGYLWGCYGAATGIFNILFFSKILRHFGEKRVFFFGMTIFTPCYILMPIMSLCARSWGVGRLVWALVVFTVLLMVLIDMSYGTSFSRLKSHPHLKDDFFLPGAIFMFVTASSPNRRSLGATNGLSQMTVSIARAIGPALSTSLFSYSVQKNILGGYGVYLLMVILSLLALVIATLLPPRVWEEKDVPSE